jgi:hypothetical protein
VTPRTGLAGAVVQRSLADWPVVLAALLLLICATTLLATGVVYGDAVAGGGLHRALLEEPASGRSVVVSLSADPAHLSDVDSVVRPALADAMATTGGDILRAVRAGSFANAATPADQVTDLATLESLDGIETQATLVDGSWPQAGGTPLQATTSDAAAAALGVHVGDRLSLVSRQDPGRRVDTVISGLWHADPAAAWSRGDPLETTGSTSGGTFTTRGPIVVREADLLGVAGSNRVDVEWRGLPDLGALRVADVDALRTSLTALPSRLGRDLPAGAQSRVTTTLPDTLVEVGRSVLVSRSGITLVTIQFVILAGYAVLLVAGLLVERRRSEIALLRSRGASATHLTRMALLEAIFLAVPAAAVAPLLAVGLVTLLGTAGPIAGLGLIDDVAISGPTIVASVIAGAVAVVILTLPTLFVSASPAGARAADARQGRASLPQRLGLDIALVAIAAVALAQLRLYGAPLTVNARGALGLDPLLVAAPAIGLIAGAVVALRIVPRIAEVLERVLVRGHGLVGALGGRQLARRPLRYSRAALLLILATALGTLTASHAATWLRSQQDQAAWQAAADVRAVAGDYPKLPSWAAGPMYRAIPGVAAATPVATVSFDLGRTIRSGTLVGVDPAGLAAVAAGSSDASAAGATSAGLAALGSVRDTAPAVPIPDGTQRLAIDLSAQFETATTDQSTGESTGLVPLPPGVPGLSAAVVLRDGDGRVFRTRTAVGSLSGAEQRLIVDLTDPAAPGRAPTTPLAVVGVELDLVPPSFDPMSGSAELLGLQATASGTGDAGWSPVAVSGATSGWHWDRTDGEQPDPYPTPAGRPNLVAAGGRSPIFPTANGGTRFRLAAGAGAATTGDSPAIPVVASDAFLAESGVSVGDVVRISSAGRTFAVRLIGSTPGIAPLDPGKPALFGDLATVDLARYGATGNVQQADEWWLRTDPGAEPAVLAALRGTGMDTSRVVGRDELARTLSTDPVPLGLIGILALGSLSAMIFATIGFLVTATVSANERLGEFALLRALGLSTRQLSWWLSIESLFLLIVGLVAGAILGAVLAWLVLPFTTLTQTGAEPVPAPAVVMPLGILLPVYAGIVLLFVLAPLLARRQLPEVRISGVLRARES